MMNCLAVGLGGFAGAVLRYLIGLIPTGETMIFPVKHGISGSFTGRKYTHPMHGKIHPQEFFRLSFLRCLVFTVEQQAGKIKRIYLFQPWIFFFISGRRIFQHLFFFLIMTDLIRKHPVIEKTTAADRLLYLS